MIQVEHAIDHYLSIDSSLKEVARVSNRLYTMKKRWSKNLVLKNNLPKRIQSKSFLKIIKIG